jgi:hypothetical protein
MAQPFIAIPFPLRKSTMPTPQGNQNICSLTQPIISPLSALKQNFRPLVHLVIFPVFKDREDNEMSQWTGVLINCLKGQGR